MQDVDYGITRIKYIYCTDTILDLDDELTMEITKESLEMQNMDTQNSMQSPRRETMSNQTSAKSTPQRMDSERR